MQAISLLILTCLLKWPKNMPKEAKIRAAAGSNVPPHSPHCIGRNSLLLLLLKTISAGPILEEHLLSIPKTSFRRPLAAYLSRRACQAWRVDKVSHLGCYQTLLIGGDIEFSRLHHLGQQQQQQVCFPSLKRRRQALLHQIWVAGSLKHWI